MITDERKDRLKEIASDMRLCTRCTRTPRWTGEDEEEALYVAYLLRDDGRTTIKNTTVLCVPKEK